MHTLFIFNNYPFVHIAAQEAFEMMLAFTNFEFSVNILLYNHAIWQLNNKQGYTKCYAALNNFGIDNIYLFFDENHSFDLDLEKIQQNLTPAITIINQLNLQQLIKRHDLIINY